ncbi:MAG: hypothetical protein IJU76_15165 [Desulfovibrionaceae bacterium]|nr:hypothetical protein [Desulfovibrionaceae bacterium]
MKKILMALFLTSVLCAPIASMAKDVDMAKITCKEFAESGKDSISMMMIWIDGYMSGKSDNTVMNEEWMDTLGTHMGRFCAQNPKKTIMAAIEAMPEN